MRQTPLALEPAASLRATWGGLGAILLWSSTIAVARSLSEQLGPATAGAAVYSVAGAFSLFRLLKFRIRGPLPLAGLSSIRLWLCGALFVIYSILLYCAVGLARDREQAIGIGLLNYLWPALTILFSLPLLHQRANGYLWPGTALSLIGVFLVMTQGTGYSWSALGQHWAKHPAAYTMALAAAISWALYSNLTRRWAALNLTFAIDLYLPATAVALWMLRLWLPEVSLWSARAGAEAAFLGSVTALAYTLWDFAMRQGRLTFIAVCSYFTPLLSTLVSCLYLGVSPTSTLWLGCSLLVAGSIISWTALKPN